MQLTRQTHPGRTLLLLILLAAVLTACNLPLANPTPAAPDRSSTVLQAVGQVTLREAAGSDARALAAGDAIAAGAEIATGADGSAVIELDDGTTIYIGPDTVVSLADLSGTAESPLTRFSLNLGEVFAVRGGEPLPDGAAFEVETPHAIAAIRGSSMGVRARALASAVLCASGVCEAGAKDGEPVPLNEGQRIEIGPEGPGEPSDFLPEDEEFIQAAQEIIDILKGGGATPAPTATATPVPTGVASPVPTTAPTLVPTLLPTATPVPTLAPTLVPTLVPTAVPVGMAITGRVFWVNDPQVGVRVELRECSNFSTCPLLAETFTTTSGDFLFNSPPITAHQVFIYYPATGEYSSTWISPPPFTITEGGYWDTGTTYLVKDMNTISPANEATVGRRVLLEWEAKPGVVRYRVLVYDAATDTRIVDQYTTETSDYVSVPAGIRCWWMIWAYVDNSKPPGYSTDHTRVYFNVTP
jgi:hypothetical protein